MIDDIGALSEIMESQEVDLRSYKTTDQEIIDAVVIYMMTSEPIIKDLLDTGFTDVADVIAKHQVAVWTLDIQATPQGLNNSLSSLLMGLAEEWAREHLDAIAANVNSYNTANRRAEEADRAYDALKEDMLTSPEKSCYDYTLQRDLAYARNVS